MNHSLKMYIFTIVFFISSVNSSEVYYPNDTWEVVSPESQNINSSRVQKLIDMSFEDDATMSVVIIKNGKIIGEQYAEGMIQIHTELHGQWQKVFTLLL